MEETEGFLWKVWEGRWRVTPYAVLPDWLRDSDDLPQGHRPPMPPLGACFHTETGNIWPHLLVLGWFSWEP